MNGATRACPRCARQLPLGAPFCDGCGARQEAFAAPSAPMVPAPVPMGPTAVPSARPGFVAAGRGMSVCHGCGAHAPTRRTSCALCDTAIGTSLEAVPPRADGTYWVQCRTSITCRQCGAKSPLDAPDLDGTIQCARCHTPQAFDLSAWDEALALAHAVGDLAGPDPEGRCPIPGQSIAGSNPFSDIGVTRTSASITLSGMSIEGGVMKTRNLELTAAPGHPLCTRCGSPLEAQASGDRVRTRCPGCADAAEYRFPRSALSHAPGLVGMIAADFAEGGAVARLDETSAGMVIAIRCPSCGGALSVEEGKPFTTCTFCRTHCRIPSRTLLALKPQSGAKETPWWALFKGPSSKRHELLSSMASVGVGAGLAASDDDEDDDDDDRPRRRRRKKQRTLPKALEMPPNTSSQAHKALQWTVRIGVPLIVAAVIGALLFSPALWAWAHWYPTKDPRVPEAPPYVRGIVP